jgi:DDE superfamily endonuclease
MTHQPVDFWQYLLEEDTSSDEEEDETLTNLVVLAVGSTQAPRPSYVVRDRLLWDQHVLQLEGEGASFHRFYRMRYSSFMKLCGLVHPFLEKNETKAKNRCVDSGDITTEIAVHCLLRWLAGGSYLDVRICAGISVTSFYVILHKTIVAVLLVEELDYKFPETMEEISQAAADFKKCSTNEFISGCVACVDGMLLQINTPNHKETGHVKSYFSGHYQTYGINIQAACDSQCRFVYAAVAAPGGTNDIAAFRKLSLSHTIEKLPIGKYVLGDNAYVCTEHMLTPFAGSQRNDQSKDAYNFYLSQVRMRIEMTFGMFANKWRVFQRPVGLSLKNVGRAFLCATKLHNFWWGGVTCWRELYVQKEIFKRKK